jgi:hypothetical protein
VVTLKKGALAETKPTPRKHWRPQGDLNHRYHLERVIRAIRRAPSRCVVSMGNHLNQEETGR